MNARGLFFRAVMPYIGIADSVLHKLGISRWPILWRVCDAYDLSLGAPDTPENFPRRHRLRESDAA